MNTQDVSESLKGWQWQSESFWICKPRLTKTTPHKRCKRLWTLFSSAKGQLMSESLATNDDLDSQEDEQSRKAKQLPQPRGYKILIALPEPEEKTAGGILKAHETLHNEEVGSIVGMVLELGPDAYSDSQRFPSGASCKKGDFILMRSFSGTRFKIHDKEFRLINDDSVEAVVEDPRGIVKL
tara:strand:+ start:3939 stop:4484 length:546 start_codon:yes stop_codon:yes gene_type:complete